MRRLQGFDASSIRSVMPASESATSSQAHSLSRFEKAMDDDLGVPAALATVHDAVREGNSALAGGDDATLKRELAFGAWDVAEFSGSIRSTEPWVSSGEWRRATARCGGQPRPTAT